MEKKNKLSIGLRIIILIICLVITFGVEFIFRSCGAQEDGGYMACHWAQQAVMAAGIILTVQAAALVCTSDKKIQQIISLTIAGGAIVTALIPNIMINLCMMPTMHCNAVMRPWTIVCCVVLFIVCVINAVINLLKAKSSDYRKEETI